MFFPPNSTLFIDGSIRSPPTQFYYSTRHECFDGTFLLRGFLLLLCYYCAIKNIKTTNFTRYICLVFNETTTISQLCIPPAISELLCLGKTSRRVVGFSPLVQKKSSKTHKKLLLKNFPTPKKLFLIFFTALFACHGNQKCATSFGKLFLRENFAKFQ